MSQDNLNDEETYSVNVNFTKGQILEFFSNMMEMHYDSDEKFLDESFCIDEKQKKQFEEKKNLGYLYLYVTPKGENYITIGQEHGDKLIAGIEYHLKHNPQVVIEQLQKILFSSGRTHELMDSVTDFGSAELMMETLQKLQAPQGLANDTNNIDENVSTKSSLKM